MSLLAPLYFLGALAISLPILFHLIRRQPRGQVEFSSLMFLRPTPPRLTRRSRLDNWPLLLIRALALMLLAAAFARPFLRSATLSDSELPGRRLMLLVDTSASMQRTGMWQQVLDEANALIDDLRPADRLAIVTFDSQPSTLLGFEQSSRIPMDKVKATAKSMLKDTAPTWHSTDLGRAISFAGDQAVAFESDGTKPVALDGEDSAAARTAPVRPAHLVLISDLQSGSQVENLQVYAWPRELRLDVRKITPNKRTNASAVILEESPDVESDRDRVRVRVANSSDATETRFRIRWVKDSAAESEGDDALTPAELAELPVHVPRGESRVVRMPIPVTGVTSLVVQGDDHSFDNTRYIVSPQPESLSLFHVGPSDAEPRESSFYYLQRVPLSNVRRTVSVESIDADQLGQRLDPSLVPLVVLEQGVSDDVAASLKEYVSSGGRLLVVMSDQRQSAGVAASINALTDSELQIAEAKIDDYAMLSKINFQHSLFESMADPKFNDFTKIRFWSHRRLTNLDDRWKVIADFDDGDPALVEYTVGDGRIFLLSAGWQPAESQLALSTKFIPLVFSFFDSRQRGSESDRYIVGQKIGYPPSPTAMITDPAGTSLEYISLEDLDRIDQPGIYQYRDGETRRTFAVNLSESESRTEALDEDELERFGIVLGKNMTTDQIRTSQRQLRDRELEESQKVWQWLLVGAIGFLALETVLGAIWSRRRPGEGLELEGA